ncbi:metallophosphoesterase [Undibacterium sp. TS12]|uniref:metallophosphoesterase n=1 Tax=Undibacterium sp. TS12 TaxID=2908202 RepID=UPI001F4CADF0|nr:metallophosphoesterase [Undibacterium sp. TS12]MCH8620356.1 metallophosphoesterase [Undibacterium sp. TS12]
MMPALTLFPAVAGTSLRKRATQIAVAALSGLTLVQASLAQTATITSQVSTATAPVTGINDGPYVFYQTDKGGLDVSWVCNDQVQKRSFTKTANVTLPAPCGYPQALTIRAAESAFPVTARFTADKLAAISDIHGQFDLMQKLLQGNGIINKDWQWTYGKGHLVITGDVFDRGPKVTEALWLLYALEEQARAAGGAVHLLIGNHEAMSLSGNVRYLNKKYAEVARQLGSSYQQMFDNNSVLGRWLRSKPVIIEVNGMLFMHGGLHPDYQNLKLSMAEINEKYRQSLGLSKEQIKTEAVLDYLYGSLGPLWYRGYFNTPKLANDDLAALLQQMKVGRIVVGHTTMDGVYSHYQGKVISIDSGIKGGVKGEMFFWENGKISKAGMDGVHAEIPDGPQKSKDLVD